MRNLILADSQDITRIGLEYILEKRMDDMLQTCYARNKAEIINILKSSQQSFIILDYTTFDFTSINELEILYARYPKTNWLLFSDELSDSFLRYLLANELPFLIVMKSDPLPEINKAIEYLLNNKPFYSKRIVSHLKVLKKKSEDLSQKVLTMTEKEILKEIALGRTTKEVALARNLSIHTVITHRKNIFRKLEVNNLHEATRYAIKAGVVDLSEYYI